MPPGPLQIEYRMADLYHIFVIPKSGVTREQIEEKLNLAIHWYRYREGIYVVQTSSDEIKWKARLKPLVAPNGRLFICKIDTTHYEGWMGKDFWEWFEPKAKKSS